MKLLSIELDDKSHKELKKISIELNKTLKQLVIESLNDFLKKYKIGDIIIK